MKRAGDTHGHPAILVLFLGLALASAACGPERDPLTMDTGLPLTDGLSAYDVRQYTIRNDVLVDRRAIAGSGSIRFEALAELDTLELDFDRTFKIDRIEDADADASGELAYTREGPKLFVELPAPLAPGDEGEVTVHYSGRPLVAERAPWDGGFVWAETPSGKPWIATAIQGEGCDLWYPCKDHPSDEPERVDLYVTVPAELSVASNGVLQAISEDEKKTGRRTFHWRTDVPTGASLLALNIAPYVLLEGTYTSINGTEVPLEFWAIEDHEEQARELFEREVPQILEFHERVLGPYPFGQEKMGVAETPHLGMEHQTVNAYGNEFKRDKYGFDWLLHHEFSHEWFGNVMTVRNWADMWLHEGFGAYMQPVYTQEVLGDAAFHARMYQSYLGIRSCQPVAPRGDVSVDTVYNHDQGGPGGDIYSKGAWVLHSLRYLISEEPFWRATRRLIYDTPTPEALPAPIASRHRTTDDFLEIVSDEAGEDLGWFFEVYLRSGPLPELELTENENGLTLTWATPNELPFPMPVPVRVDGEIRRVEMPGGTATLPGRTSADVQVDPFMRILRKLPTVPTCEEREAEEKQADST